jgi:serine/threonine protein kinase
LLSVKTIGRYRVERLLGAGGFGVVWLARDTMLDSPVAIKVLAENAAARLDLRRRFLAEAQLLRQVGSPRVVQIYDIGELPDARPYFVMEHANKGTLADLLSQAQGGLPTSRALRLAAQVAYAVGELHERGVLHRDIKPSNVLIASAASGPDRVLIADLGLAKDLAAASGLTHTAGTVGYMAPEQYQRQSGGMRLDERADIYGLGALTYMLLSGVEPGPPWKITPLGVVRPGLPPDVVRLVTAALSDNRDLRPSTAAAMGTQLDLEADRVESSEPVQALAGEPASRARRPKRGLAVAAVITFVALIASPLTAHFGDHPADTGAVAGFFRAPPAGSAPMPPSSVAATSTPSPSAGHRAEPSSATPKRPPAAASIQAKTSPSPPVSVTPTSTLPAQLTIERDRQLYSGQSWQTTTVKMTMQANGDLVLLARGSGRQLWHSNTAGTGYRAIMQADGNFVVYDRKVYGVWSTVTAGHDGAVLEITGAGDVELRYQGKTLWSVDTSA